MIKRRAALFFLSMAWLIVTAHAIVPHHHHNEWMCIQQAHCSSEKHGDEKTTSQHDHEDECLLVQLVVRTETQEEEISVPSSEFHYITDFTLPEKPDEPDCTAANILKSFIPEPSSSYLHYAAAALVKRAPPVA